MYGFQKNKQQTTGHKVDRRLKEQLAVRSCTTQVTVIYRSLAPTELILILC